MRKHKRDTIAWIVIAVIVAVMAACQIHGQDSVPSTSGQQVDVYTPTPAPTATATPKVVTVMDTDTMTYVNAETVAATLTSQQLFDIAARKRLRELKEKGDYTVQPVATPKPRKHRASREQSRERAEEAYNAARLEQRMSRPIGTPWRNFSGVDEHGYPNN